MARLPLAPFTDIWLPEFCDHSETLIVRFVLRTGVIVLTDEEILLTAVRAVSPRGIAFV